MSSHRRPSRAQHSGTDPRTAYLDLLKQSITDLLAPETYSVIVEPGVGLKTVPLHDGDRYRRLEGRDWPANGLTMIGMKRLDNLQHCVEDVLVSGVPGDLIETGVWRGGAAIFMRAILRLHDVNDRRVWVADSFQGLPPPRPETYPADSGDSHHKNPFLAVSLADVKRNFERYGQLDEQVVLLEGWFQDTLPALHGERWSVVRLDGDMYESTIVALRCLYPGLAAGGYLIVDDYGAREPCKMAVDAYRAEHDIREEIEWVDWTGVYWQKHASVPDFGR